MNELENIKEWMPLEIEPPTLETVTERTKYRMKAYIISMVNNHDSTVGARKVIQSINLSKSNIQPFIFPAVTPDTLDETHKQLFGKSAVPNISWTYPTKESENRYDIRTGLQLSYYPTKDIRKRIACTLSHYSLWLHCYQIDEPIMILEHDASFIREFDYSKLQGKFTGDILGLNNPIGATRRASKFDEIVRKKYSDRWDKLKKYPIVDVMETPWIDNQMVPQGLAGNSAYIIKPEGAAALIALTAENGLWPNDAIMCKQLMPGKLQVAYPYYTKVTGMKSTTSE